MDESSLGSAHSGHGTQFGFSTGTFAAVVWLKCGWDCASVYSGTNRWCCPEPAHLDLHNHFLRAHSCQLLRPAEAGGRHPPRPLLSTPAERIRGHERGGGGSLPCPTSPAVRGPLLRGPRLPPSPSLRKAGTRHRAAPLSPPLASDAAELRRPEAAFRFVSLLHCW